MTPPDRPAAPRAAAPRAAHAAGPIDVVHFSRRPQAGQHSIEKVFALIRSELPERFNVTTVVSEHYSKGVLPRAATVLEARRITQPVVHILGDITYAALARRASSTVLTVHDTEFLRRASPLKRTVYSSLWLRFPIRHAAVVTVPSRATLRELENLGVAEHSKLRLIPHPVGDGFTPTPAAAPATPAPAGAQEPSARPDRTTNRPIVLVVGTAPNKNLPVLAEALSGLDYQLVVVGSLDAAQRGAFARARVEVRELGTVADEAMPGVYRAADVLAFVSTTEGFGVPILEANASGLAVVTSDLDPHRDVAGGAARLVDPADPASVRAGLQAVLDDDNYRRHLTQAGLRNAAAYAPKRVAGAYAEIYDELAALTEDIHPGRD